MVELKASEPSADEIRKIEKIAKDFNLKAEIYVACLKCKPKKIGSVKILLWQDVIKEIVERAILLKI